MKDRQGDAIPEMIESRLVVDGLSFAVHENCTSRLPIAMQIKSNWHSMFVGIQQ